MSAPEKLDGRLVGLTTLDGTILGMATFALVGPAEGAAKADPVTVSTRAAAIRDFMAGFRGSGVFSIGHSPESGDIPVYQDCKHLFAARVPAFLRNGYVLPLSEKDFSGL
jgi:hypothetical protein